MKTDKEIAAEAQKRAREINKSKRNHWIGSAGLAAACIALVIGLSYVISQMSGVIFDNDIGSGSAYTAAIFAGGGAGGYVLIGVIAFALGALVTIIAMRNQRKK